MMESSELLKAFLEELGLGFCRSFLPQKTGGFNLRSSKGWVEVLLGPNFSLFQGIPKKVGVSIWGGLI
jgi:hypothetical protein